MRALTGVRQIRGLSFMRTYLEAKLMAKSLRETLRARRIELSHGESLEIVAQVFSGETAIEFYCDYLGLVIDWKHGQPDPTYMQVSRGDLVLHLTEHHDDVSPGSTAFVLMKNIDAYHAELHAKNYRYMNPGIEQLPWGRVLGVIDPFSNRLRFCERK
jgi:hypothetical protein